MSVSKEHKSRKILGIALHNWIFVGILVGILVGFVTFNIDHHDILEKANGGILEGHVEAFDGGYAITLADGREERLAASEVMSVTLARDTTSGAVYGQLVWWYNLLGKVIFIGILKMLIAPLIFASIVAGIVSLKQLDELRRIGFKTMAYYFLTTTLAVTIGLVAVLVIRPGKQDASLAVRQAREAEFSRLQAKYEATGAQAIVNGEPTVDYKLWVADQEAERLGSGHEAERFRKLLKAKDVSPGDLLKNQLLEPMIMNPFQSLVEKNSLGIIAFALLLGIAIVVVGAPAQPLADLFIAGNEVIIRITTWLMALAPIFVMFLIAELIATNGPNVFGSLAWYCVTVIGGIAVHVAALFAIAQVLAGVNPKQLWAGIREAWMVAFTTRSSAATLPVTMRCVTEKLGVSPRVANFGLPVGATMNMDGTALYEGVAVIFLIQIYQGLPDVPIELGGAATLLIFITAVMASIGAAAVPDAGLVTMVIVANAVGLPIYYIPLIFAVDTFLDMFRTSTNILGDAVGTLVVQKLEEKNLIALE